MLKKASFFLFIALIIIVIAGEKNLKNVQYSQQAAFLPEIETVQAQPVSFSEKLATGLPVTIVFLGDYVTSADSLPDGNPNHVLLLTEWFNDQYPNQVTTINAGMNANTISHMKERIESDVLTYTPDLVVISTGLNDALGAWKISVDEYDKDYQAVIDEILATGRSEVLIRTPNPTNSVEKNKTMRPYMRVSRELAKRDNVYVFDFYNVMATDIHAKDISQVAFMQNTFYPNTKGQAYLFDKFKTYLTTEFIQP